MGNKNRPKTNAEMCEIVILRRKTRAQDERIKELEKMLSRSLREIKAPSAQYDDNGSEHLISKINSLLEQK